MSNPLRLVGYDRDAARHFLIIGLASQIIYGVDALREVLYDQYIAYLGVNNTQFGILMTITSISYILFILFGWIHNIFRPKILVLIGLATNFLVGLVVFIRPNMGFAALAPWYFLYAVKEVAFWPAVLNYVRSFSHEGNQGLTFSLHEVMRRIVAIMSSLGAIGLLAVIGNAFLGIRIAILFVILFIGLFFFLILRFVPNIKSATPPKRPMLQRFSAYGRLAASPEIWFIGICGIAQTMSFYIILLVVPLLRRGFQLDPATAGIIALVIGAVVGSFSSFFGGILSDRFFKSPARTIKYLLYMLFLALLFTIILPKTPAFALSGITSLVLISGVVFMLRGLSFAPVAEVGIPPESNGAAVSIVSFITYSPGLWMHMVNGKLLDIFSEDIATAYNIMLSLCLISCTLGIIAAHRLSKKIKQKRLARQSLQLSP